MNRCAVRFLPRRLWLAALLLVPLWAAAPDATAQYAVDPGEAIAADTLAVMSTPVAGAAKVMEVEAGRTVTVLGYPRGTGMAWIAIGGRELGYVNAADLAPIDRQRPELYRAAVVSAVRADPGGVLPGDQVLPAGPGRLVTVAGMNKGRAVLDGGDAAGVPPQDLLPVIGTYAPTALTPGAPGFFTARLGRYAGIPEALRHWEEVTSLLPELRELSPYVYRRVTPQGLGVEMAAGPFDRSRVEEVCTMLARRGRDCWVVAVEVH